MIKEKRVLFLYGQDERPREEDFLLIETELLRMQNAGFGRTFCRTQSTDPGRAWTDFMALS